MSMPTTITIGVLFNWISAKEDDYFVYSLFYWTKTDLAIYLTLNALYISFI